MLRRLAGEGFVRLFELFHESRELVGLETGVVLDRPVGLQATINVLDGRSSQLRGPVEVIPGSLVRVHILCGFVDGFGDLLDEFFAIDLRRLVIRLTWQGRRAGVVAVDQHFDEGLQRRNGGLEAGAVVEEISISAPLRGCWRLSTQLADSPLESVLLIQNDDEMVFDAAGVDLPQLTVSRVRQDAGDPRRLERLRLGGVLLGDVLDGACRRRTSGGSA